MTQVDHPHRNDVDLFGKARSHVYGQLQRSLNLAYPLPIDPTGADQKFELLLEQIRNCRWPDGDSS